MRLNVNEFKTFLKKATLNFSIDSVHINIKADKISTIMTNSDFSAIVILNRDNNIFGGVGTNEEYDLYFQDPNRQIIPFLNLIDENEVDFLIREDQGKVILKSGNQKSSIFLCSPDVVSTFNRSTPREELNPVFETNMGDIAEYLKKIKKIGTRFGKIYFGEEKKKFYVETTDKESGRFTNSLRFDIVDSSLGDFTTCFRFKSVMNVFAVLDDLEEYSFKLSTKMEDEAVFGLIKIEKSDLKETYYLMSILETS